MKTTILLLLERRPGRKDLFRCECGTEKLIDRYAVRAGNTKSCGCRRIEVGKSKANQTKHGDCRRSGATPEYRAWKSMIDRCTRPHTQAYILYGNRGISVYSKWLDSYEEFLKDVGRRPTPKHSLGRKDNDGNYEPENVEWQTAKEQNRNKRGLRMLTKDGITKSATEWAEELGVNRQTIYLRLSKGDSDEQSLRPSRRK